MTVLLTYGNRRRPYRIEGRLSTVFGKTWLPKLQALSGPLYGCQLDEERTTDLGYPSNVVLEDGSLVTMYYLDPFALNARREWTGPETTPFYLETGYQSRVIRWNVAE